MKKVCRLNLFELKEKGNLIDKASQTHFVGGGSGTSGDPFTEEEFNYLSSYGCWQGGWVEGMGWVTPDVYIYSSKPGGYNYGSGNHGSGSTPNWPSWPGGGGNYYVNPNHRPGYGGYTPYWGYYNNHYTYNNGYYYGYYSYGGSSGGHWNGSPDDNSLTDGVNINNSLHFTLNTGSQPVFNEQLTNILKSNSVLKALLSYFDNGIIHMTFDIAEMNSIAQTTYPSHDSFHIIFSEKFIDDEGWNKILKQDNINYDWNKVCTAEEALVVVLAHESQHANHVARFFDAVQQTGNNPTKTANLLKEWGYSQEYVDIFIEYRDGECNYASGNQQVANMHDYMDKYNHGIIDAALDEYRKDYNK